MAILSGFIVLSTVGMMWFSKNKQSQNLHRFGTIFFEQIRYLLAVSSPIILLAFGSICIASNEFCPENRQAF